LEALAGEGTTLIAELVSLLVDAARKNDAVGGPMHVCSVASAAFAVHAPRDRIFDAFLGS
jgi:hypothetical protein